METHSDRPDPQNVYRLFKTQVRPAVNQAIRLSDIDLPQWEAMSQEQQIDYLEGLILKWVRARKCCSELCRGMTALDPGIRDACLDFLRQMDAMLNLHLVVPYAYGEKPRSLGTASFFGALVDILGKLQALGAEGMEEKTVEEMLVNNSV